MVQLHQLLTLGPVFTLNIEFRQNEVKQLARIHSGVEQKCRLGTSQVQPVQQPIYQGCFPGSHFTGQRDESFARLYSVHQSRQRFLDLFRQKQKPRVRIDIERIFFQPKEAFVHDLLVVSVVSSRLACPRSSVYPCYRSTSGRVCQLSPNDTWCVVKLNPPALFDVSI